VNPSYTRQDGVRAPKMAEETSGKWGRRQGSAAEMAQRGRSGTAPAERGGEEKRPATDVTDRRSECDGTRVDGVGDRRMGPADNTGRCEGRRTGAAGGCQRNHGAERGWVRLSLNLFCPS
jgi:hypothetical protein